ncbi:MAG: hypothetical protein K2N56_12520 [Oscillospiraceae bacterium]|nr:hypothetical protein [Oscillospiraceae bacterium]
MVKKIGSLGLLVGGVLALIGAIGAIVNSMSVNVKATMDMAVLARVGSIIAFVAAIIAVAGVVMTNAKKGGAIASMIFGVLAFIGQFLINPITSWQAATDAAFGGNAKGAAGGAIIGLILIAISGIVLLILGIVGLVSKNKNNTFNG